jgi:hypothetical protein
LRANPLHEPLQRVDDCVRLPVRVGRPRRWCYFERLRTVLRRELGWPSRMRQTRQLYRDLLAGGTRGASTPRAANLPARVAALVGRERELEETARIPRRRAGCSP